MEGSWTTIINEAHRGRLEIEAVQKYNKGRNRTSMVWYKIKSKAIRSKDKYEEN